MTALRWRTKRAVDVLGAVGGLVVLGPLLLLIAFAVWHTLGSPVLLRQARAGRHARPFHLLKLRTMAGAHEDGGTPLPDGDPFARLGSWLRGVGLDGLPALINVLRGEMSLVGPWPLPLEYLPRCSAKQARRHQLRPGMTGWAAIQGGRSASWERRLALDVWYVDNWSLALDAKILVMTAVKILRHENKGAGGPSRQAEPGPPRAAAYRAAGRAGPETLALARGRRMADQARARARQEPGLNCSGHVPSSSPAAPRLRRIIKRPGSVSDRFDLLVPTGDPGNLALAVRDQAALILTEPFQGGHRERSLASQLPVERTTRGTRWRVRTCAFGRRA